MHITRRREHSAPSVLLEVAGVGFEPTTFGL